MGQSNSSQIRCSLRIFRAKTKRQLQQVNQIQQAFLDDMPALGLEGRNWWLALVDDQVAGYAGSKQVGFDTWFNRCGVLKPYRGNGIQKRLIRYRIMQAKRAGSRQIWTYTVNGNHPSASSLITAGFRTADPDYAYFGTRDILYWRLLLCQKSS